MNDLVKSGPDISTKTDTREPDGNGLWGCRPRRTPLVKKRHLQARLKFKGQPGEQLCILVTCPLVRWETLELFVHRDVPYVWSKKGLVLNPKNTISRVKHAGGSVMLWDVSLRLELGILSGSKESYKKILKNMVWVSVLSCSMIATQSKPHFW